LCGFCGLVGGALHWSEVRQSAQASGDPATHGARQREQLRRSALLNRITRHYGVRVQPWADTSWIVSHLTGETVIVDRLADLWPTVERLAKRPCDPLSPEFLASFQRGI
jgi:hypothetical protein